MNYHRGRPSLDRRGILIREEIPYNGSRSLSHLCIQGIAQDKLDFLFGSRQGSLRISAWSGVTIRLTTWTGLGLPWASFSMSVPAREHLDVPEGWS